MPHSIKNHGLIIPNIETREEGVNHILGTTELKETILNPSGTWMDKLPDGETQRRKGIETNSCTIHTISNAEDMLKKCLGEPVNSSERYLANVAENKNILNPSVGADPHRVAEMRRNESGSVLEDLAPWLDSIQTVDDYYSLDVMPLIPTAVREYKRWRFNHKWLWSGNPPPQEKRVRIKDGLKKGVVGVSGVAWVSGPGYYIKPFGATDGHNFIIAEAQDALPYKAWDSYPESEGDFIKDLDPLYDFAIGKVYWLTPVPHLFRTNLYFGMIHEDARALQKALLQLNYNIPDAPTSVYGKQTRAAVASFQKDHGIVDDGTHFGPRTRYALNMATRAYEGLSGMAALVSDHFASIFSGV